jgi:ubiquinone/menaquinone biosynthesis C-methylase UbiE
MQADGSRLLSSLYEEHHLKGKRLRQSFVEEQRKDLFLDWIGSGKEILDLGGRDGTLSRHFQSSNNVTLADIDSAALQDASARFCLNTIQVNLNEALPFEDGVFDAVVMGEVLEHLPYLKISLSEARRVLRVGGLFVGSIPLAYHLKDRYRVLRGKKLLMAGDPTHLQFFKYDEVVGLLSDYFELQNICILKGGKIATRFPSLFARNIAFCCLKH